MQYVQKLHITGKRHQKRSVDVYNKLPDLFTKKDVIRCFGYEKENSVRGKFKRLIDCSINKSINLSEHFTLGEVTKGNRPSPKHYAGGRAIGLMDGAWKAPY